MTTARNINYRKSIPRLSSVSRGRGLSLIVEPEGKGKRIDKIWAVCADLLSFYKGKSPFPIHAPPGIVLTRENYPEPFRKFLLMQPKGRLVSCEIYLAKIFRFGYLF